MEAIQQYIKKNGPWIWIILFSIGSILYFNWQSYNYELKLEEFFSSVFFVTIAGSFAAAFAGAYGAQRIAERAKYREQLLKEIRSTNTVIMLSFGICNSLLSMKKQHLLSMKENIHSQRAALLEFTRKRNLGLINKEQEFQYLRDFQTLSLPPLPVDILQTQAFEKLSLVGRPISLTTTLIQTIHSLSSFLEKRNQQIEIYKEKGEPTTEEYFGLPTKGQLNEIYPSLIDAIYSQTDNAIYFSQLLCQDLLEHGNKYVEIFNKSFRKGAPTMSKPDFSKAESLGLMPNAEDYADWNTAFVSQSSN